MAGTIKDPVHGYIALDDLDSQLIDLPVFQRLKQIRQNGLGAMVYPSATHTRFEHCLGAMHLASQAMQNLLKEADPKIKAGWTEPEQRHAYKVARYAGLFHDVGHTPLSHATESLMDAYTPKLIQDLVSGGLTLVNPKMDQFTTEMLLTQKSKKHQNEILSAWLVVHPTAGIKNLLEGDEINPLDVAACILGLTQTGRTVKEDPLSLAKDLISSDIDVDKLDYILRDGHMSGAGLSIIDKQRVLDSYVATEDGLAFSKRGLSAVGNWIHARTQAYLWIYKHHKKVYFEHLLSIILKKLFEANPPLRDKHLSPDLIASGNCGDHSLFELLDQKKDDPLIRDYAKQLLERKTLSSLWKNAVDYHLILDSESEEVANELTRAIESPNRLRKIEATVRDALGLKEHELFVVATHFTQFDTQNSSIPINIRGRNWDAIEDLGFRAPLQTRYAKFLFVYYLKTCDSTAVVKALAAAAKSVAST